MMFDIRSERHDRLTPAGINDALLNRLTPKLGAVTISTLINIQTVRWQIQLFLRKMLETQKILRNCALGFRLT